MDYTLRAVREGDIYQLVQLCREHAEFEQASYGDNGQADSSQADRLRMALFSDNPCLACVVVESGGMLVGYASYMMQYATWDAAHYLYLDCLYLRPEARGRGLGKKLMAHFQQVAIERGCLNIQWQTPEFNENAIGFYQHLGAISKPKRRFFLSTVT